MSDRREYRQVREEKEKRAFGGDTQNQNQNQRPAAPDRRPRRDFRPREEEEGKWLIKGPHGEQSVHYGKEAECRENFCALTGLPTDKVTSERLDTKKPSR